MKKEIIFVYSAGRCGTAYLTQVFGFDKWARKKDIFQPKKGVVVFHEVVVPSARTANVLKEYEPLGKVSMNLQRIYVQGATKKIHYATKIFVTSNLFARLCGDFIVQNHKRYKCIFLSRNEDTLLNSYLRRYNNYRKAYGKKEYERWLKQKFDTTMYTPMDPYSLTKMKETEWNKLSLKEKLHWYFIEIKARGERLKSSMEPGSYIETSYEKIITVKGLDELSKFIELPYSKELMKHKVNKSEKFQEA